MHVKVQGENNFVEKVWPENLALFMFRPTLKQLNNLSAIDTFSCLGGPEVTLQTRVQEVSIHASGNTILCLLFCFLVVVFLLFCLQHITCHEHLNFLL